VIPANAKSFGIGVATVEIPFLAQIPAMIVGPNDPIPHDGKLPRQIEPVE
jgi:hypothetical protein